MTWLGRGIRSCVPTVAMKDLVRARGREERARVNKYKFSQEALFHYTLV